MRAAAAIGLAVFAIGAALAWATEWTVAGADGDTVGALLMIAGGAAVLVVVFLAASRRVQVRDGARETVPEPDDRLSAGRPWR